jgi:hypothetical protein
MIPPFSPSFSAPFGRTLGSEAIGEFDPLAIPNLFLWHDAADAASIIANTPPFVDEWIDKSGGGNSGQGPGGAQPLTGLRTINGLNVILFNGASDFLDHSGFNLTSSLTIAFVFKALAITNNNGSLVSFDDVGNEDFQISAGASPSFFSRFESTGLGISSNVEVGSNITQTPIALMYRLDISDGSLRLYSRIGEIDSDLNYNGNLSTANIDFKIGVDRGGTFFLNCEIGEMLFYGRAISDQERNAIFDYFTSKWGALGDGL